MKKSKLSAKGKVQALELIVLFYSFFLHLCFANAETSSAQLLYSRLTGVKLNYSSPTLRKIQALIESENFRQAAEVAMDSDDFYNVGLFQYFAPLSTRSESPDTILNDMIAMGIANTFKDPRTGKDRPYTDLVTGDFTVRLDGRELELQNNDTLSAAYQRRVVLTPRNLTLSVPQRANFPDAAGVLTSRQFLSEHAVAGTNRRLVHYAFRAFLCTDIKEWRDADLSISDEYVARDVSRAPGGGVAGMNVYQTDCRSCHQVQDGLRNAFAYHDFDITTGVPKYLSGLVASKINKNIEFGGGFQVASDAWENKAIFNANLKRFGWRGAMRGNGAKSLGHMIARSERFSICAVERVFKQVCKRGLNPDEEPIKQQLAADFENKDYSLRGLFQSVALTPACLQLGEKK